MRRDSHLITPGVGVGKLRLGDSLSRVQAFFSQEKGESQGCGVAFRTVVRSQPEGNLTAYVEDGNVFQIDSGTPRYHTAKGVKAYDDPQRVKAHYKNLRAYADDYTSMALGDRPVIYWVDEERGIAFEFAYYREEHQRYLYSIIVFQPKGLFCPEGERSEPSHWHKLLPYSLELQDHSARLLPE